MEAGNAYLPEFREDFNRRFAVVPAAPMMPTAPCSKPKTWISSSPIRKRRTLSKNLTVQFNKVIYQIQSNRPDYALRNAQVTVCENAQGEVTILYKTNP
jgi:hypothetical protein